MAPFIKMDKKTVQRAVRHRIRLLSRLPGFGKVRFIMLHGSSLSAGMRIGSDIDLCVYYDGTPHESSLFRLAALSLPEPDDFDIQIFSDLPLYVRREVLKGEVVFTRDIRFVYDTAVATYREFEMFRHRLDDYTGEMAIT